MDVPRDELAAVAAAAAQAPGEFLVERFRAGPVAGEYGADDVKTDADREAEQRILPVVEDHFPGHATHGEESGYAGDSDYVWVVDPLDGTNNFASGLPCFATAVTVLHDDEPVAAAVYEPLPDTLYLAERGNGATVDGDPLRAGSEVDLSHGTVSLVVGLPAIRDEARATVADDVEDALDSNCKRVLETWSPCVDWGLVAGGAIEGIVCYHPDVYEQYAGELLAREAGLATRSAEGLFVGAGDAATLSALWETVTEVVPTDLGSASD